MSAVEERVARSVALEQAYVHDVYEQFSDSPRSRPWPRVQHFLDQLEPGSLVCDVGCGNGKYLNVNNNSIFTVGGDKCSRLSELAREKENEVMILDNLALPFRDESLDAVLSIAVVHHFATTERRVCALRELARVLRIGGRLIISVWAMEQSHRKFESQDVLVPWHRPQHLSSPSLEMTSTTNTSEDDGYPPYHAYTQTSDSDSTRSHKAKGNSRKKGRTKHKGRSIDPGRNSSPSSSSLSSPNETCYSFVRRAIQKLAGGKRVGVHRPWFLESWSTCAKEPPQKRYDPEGCDCCECDNVQDLPIELRRVDDDDMPQRRQTFPSSQIFNDLYSNLKSKSMTNIKTVENNNIIRSQSSVPSIPESVISESGNDSGCNSKPSSNSNSLAKPRLVKQKKSICDEEAEEALDKPTDMKSLIPNSPENKKRLSVGRYSRGNVFKQRSLNEELMSTERLREKEKVRQNIQKQASLNEDLIYPRHHAFDTFRDSLFSVSTAKRFQLIKTGFTNKIKNSTTNIEKVTGTSLKNGFVRMFQNWKSSELISPTIPEDDVAETKKLTPVSDEKKDSTSSGSSERRHSKEDGSDSSKDSSLQSDTSVDSEDSFASVIFVPKSDPMSPTLSPGPTSPRVNTSVPNSPRIKQSSCPTSPRIKQMPLSIYPLTKQLSSPKPTTNSTLLDTISPVGGLQEKLEPLLKADGITGGGRKKCVESLAEKYSVQQIPKFRPNSLNSSGESLASVGGNGGGNGTNAGGCSHGNVGCNHGSVGCNHGSVGGDHGNIGSTHGNIGGNQGNVGSNHGNCGGNHGSVGSNHGTTGGCVNCNGNVGGNGTNGNKEKILETFSIDNNNKEKLETLKKIRELLSQKPGFGVRTSRSNYPIVRHSSVNNGRVELIAKPLPKLLSLELFNPETDDKDSDSSAVSSPDSIDSVISVEVLDVPTLGKKTKTKFPFPDSPKSTTSGTVDEKTGSATLDLNDVHLDNNELDKSDIKKELKPNKNESKLSKNGSKLNKGVDKSELKVDKSESRLDKNESNLDKFESKLDKNEFKLNKTGQKSDKNQSKTEQKLGGQKSNHQKGSKSSGDKKRNYGSERSKSSSFEDKSKPSLSMTLLEAAADVAHSLDEAVEKVIKSSPRAKRRELKANEVISVMQRQYSTDSTPLLSDDSCNLDVENSWNDECHKHLTDFADKLSEKLLKEIDQYQEEKRRRALSSSLDNIDIDDPYIHRLSEELQDLSKLSAEIEKQNKYLAQLSQSDKLFECSKCGKKCICRTSFGESSGSGGFKYSKLTSEKSSERCEHGKAGSSGCKNGGKDCKISISGGSSLSADGELRPSRTNESLCSLDRCDTKINSEGCDHNAESSSKLSANRNPIKTGASVESCDSEKGSSPNSMISSVTTSLHFGHSIESTEGFSDKGSSDSHKDTNSFSRYSDGGSTASLASCPEWKTIKNKLAPERSASEDKTELSQASSGKRKEKSLSDTSQESLPSDNMGGEITYHRYYHVFREGELDQLIERYVENLHIISSYYDHASWCVIAEKVQVWTI